MDRDLLHAMHVALTEAWCARLPLEVAKERAANALQSLAVYEPGDDIHAPMREGLRMVGQSHVGGTALSQDAIERMVADGADALLAVLLTDARERGMREDLWDALGQVPVR